MTSQYPAIAVIGRPNVGKSTLFNRLLGRRKALVHHVPGTTRDRNEEFIEWNGRGFRLVDTGGWAHHDAIFSVPVRKQMESALKEAELVLLIVDGKEGIHSLDIELAHLARKNGKKTILVINKIDSAGDEMKTAEFYGLGIPIMIDISADHGRNIAELLELVLANLPEEVQQTSDEPRQPEKAPIHLIIIGKPNVGKSSLLNALTHSERSIVHHLPGTTREAIDTPITYEDQPYVIIDTPGLHRKHKFKNDMDYLMSLSTHHAMERADVAALVIDVEQGIGETEAKLASMILENKKACLLVVNKWDLVENREEAVAFVKRELEQKLKFLWWTKVIFISAKTGQRIERVLTEAKEIFEHYSAIIPEQILKDTIRAAETRKPYARGGEVLRIREVRQLDTYPPVIAISVSDPELVHFSYKRYLENFIRERIELTGTPIILRFFRAKPKAGKTYYEPHKKKTTYK